MAGPANQCNGEAASGAYLRARGDSTLDRGGSTQDSTLDSTRDSTRDRVDSIRDRVASIRDRGDSTLDRGDRDGLEQDNQRSQFSQCSQFNQPLFSQLQFSQLQFSQLQFSQLQFSQHL